MQKQESKLNINSKLNRTIQKPDPQIQTPDKILPPDMVSTETFTKRRN